MRAYATSCAHTALKAAASNSFLEQYMLICWQTAQRNTYRKVSLSLICSCASWKQFFHLGKGAKERQGDLFPSFMWTWLSARAELSTTITSTELPNQLYTGKQMSLLYNSSKIVTGSSTHSRHERGCSWDLWQQLRSNKLPLIAQLSRSSLLRKLIQQLVLTPGPQRGCWLHYKTSNEIAVVILNDRVIQLYS